MKKSWGIGIAVVFLVVVGVLVFGGCHITSRCTVFEGRVMCSDSPEERCSRLGSAEERCCFDSLEDAREKGWEVLPADCCFEEESGGEICRDIGCLEGFESIKAMCRGSLTFCVIEEKMGEVINPVDYSNVGEGDEWEFWGFSPKERCEELNGSERECCFDSLREFAGEKVLPVDCYIEEESGFEVCADFDCYSLYGSPEIGTKWDLVDWGCEGSLEFCVPGSWDVAR